MLTYKIESERKRIEEFRAGVLVVLDGVDGAGKTSLVQRLKDSIRKRFDFQTHSFAFPGAGIPDVRKIMKYYDDISSVSKAFVSLADMTALAHRSLYRLLDTPKTVVLLDRYYLSTFVYQGVLGSYDPKAYSAKDRELFVLSLIHTSGLPRPNVSFIPDISFDVGVQRRTYRTVTEKPDVYESMMDFDKRYYDMVREAYLRAAEVFVPAHVLDASKSLEDLEKEILDKLVRYLPGPVY